MTVSAWATKWYLMNKGTLGLMRPYCTLHHEEVNTLRPRQDGRYFADDVLKCIFLNENVWISLKIPLKFVPKGPINNIPALVQIMAWRRPGDKPLSEPMLVFVLRHICVTRPQWVNALEVQSLQTSINIATGQPSWTWFTKDFPITPKKLMEISFCSYPSSNKPTSTKFCTWHDSSAVMSCAKIWSDKNAKTEITRWIFHQISILMEGSWVIGEMGPRWSRSKGHW